MKLFTMNGVYIKLDKSVWQTENGLEHSFVKHWLNTV